ncbi:hypothetical protein [Streptomyces sp. NPDC097610]|uniref:hypothetical protein n=1 Tax=Streptomyces sp. NPDC097610 TaxID=3157227 RepID=UPI0033224516
MITTVAERARLRPPPARDQNQLRPPGWEYGIPLDYVKEPAAYSRGEALHLTSTSDGRAAKIGTRHGPHPDAHGKGQPYSWPTG